MSKIVKYIDLVSGYPPQEERPTGTIIEINGEYIRLVETGTQGYCVDCCFGDYDGDCSFQHICTCTNLQVYERLDAMVKTSTWRHVWNPAR
jgi:hypothetical protein